MMRLPRLSKAAMIPATGILAIALAAVLTAVPPSSADEGGDPSRDSDDGKSPIVSHTVPQHERNATVDYWTPERMADAEPA